LSELYAETGSDVSDNSENEILDSDSDVSTTSSLKQLQPSDVVFASDSETGTEEEESSELEISDGKASDVWCKTDKKPSGEPFFGTPGLNIVIDNPESFVEVVSSFIADNLIKLLTEQSNLYNSKNVQKLNVSPKTLKWSNITPEKL